MAFNVGGHIFREIWQVFFTRCNYFEVLSGSGHEDGFTTMS